MPKEKVLSLLSKAKIFQEVVFAKCYNFWRSNQYYFNKRPNQSGTSLADANSDSESKKILVEQKIFSGFKGLNTFKKTELELQKANLLLKKTEQQTILDTSSAYFDLIFKFKNKEFNFANVNLFERQVDSDNARLQKGEITLTDLAQSESSLARARANLIKAQTELLVSKQISRELQEKNYQTQKT